MAAVWESHHVGLRAARASRRVGATAAIALHLAAAAALLAYEPTRTALLDAAPIMVDLITPAREQPKPPPPTELPRPKPVAKVPLKFEQPPIITAPAAASPIVAPASPPEPPAPVVAAPVAAPVTIVPPVFNADYLDNPAPAYPPLSRRMREEGRVTLRVLVNPAGRADDVQIRASSGFARLDETARETVRSWKFVPARRGSEAVPAWVLIPISFKLEG